MRFLGILNKPGFAFLGGMLVMALLLGGRWAIAAWVDPTDPPPGGDIEPPINTSTVMQTKKGSLKIGENLDVTGNLGVGGTASFSSLNVTNMTITGTLGVGGLSSLAGGVIASDGGSYSVSLGKQGNNIFTESDDLILKPNDGASIGTVFKNGANDQVVAQIDNNGVLSVGNSSLDGGLETSGDILYLNQTNKKPVSVGTSLDPLTGNNHGVSLFAKPLGGNAALYVYQDGTLPEQQANLSGLFTGRVQIGGSVQTSGNALGIYSDAPLGSAGLYIEQTGGGKAATFSGNVLVKNQASAGQLEIGESGDPIMGNKDAVIIYTDGQARGLVVKSSGIGRAIDVESEKGSETIFASQKGNPGFGIYGKSETGTGVYGYTESSSGAGVFGKNTSGAGVKGYSDGTYGLLGETNGTDKGDAGVYGRALNSGGAGIRGAGNASGGKAAYFDGDAGVEINDKVIFNIDADEETYFIYDNSDKCLKLYVGSERVSQWPDEKNGGSCKAMCSSQGGYCSYDPCPAVGYKEVYNLECSIPGSPKCCIPEDAQREY